MTSNARIWSSISASHTSQWGMRPVSTHRVTSSGEWTTARIAPLAASRERISTSAAAAASICLARRSTKDSLFHTGLSDMPQFFRVFVRSARPSSWYSSRSSEPASGGVVGEVGLVVIAGDVGLNHARGLGAVSLRDDAEEVSVLSLQARGRRRPIGHVIRALVGGGLYRVS